MHPPLDMVFNATGQDGLIRRRLLCIHNHDVAPLRGLMLLYEVPNLLRGPVRFMNRKLRRRSGTVAGCCHALLPA